MRSDAPSHASPSSPQVILPPDDDGDRCPICGEPVGVYLTNTEDGPAWFAECAACNAIAEILL